MGMREFMVEYHNCEQLIFIDPPEMDSAIIGVADFAGEHRVVYDALDVIAVLCEGGMDEPDAAEYAEHNIFNAHFGEQTPVFVWPTGDA